MALLQPMLASELANIELSTTEVDAINNMSDALNNYLSQMISNAIPLATAIAAKAAMTTALTGLSMSGATAIQAGIVAYWGVVALPGAFGASTASIPPPSLATIATALTPVFASNVSAELDANAATSAIAAVLHPLMLGGTVTFPGPVVFPIL